MAAKKPPAPTIVGDWQLIHGVGNGAFGAAIKARNIHTQKLAVLKFLSPQQKATDPKEIESEARRFKNEMKLLSAFDSQYISKLYDADMNANPPWIALQYFAGTTVLEEISENGPIDEAKWFELAHDILSALAYIHSKGVIHRDLNPKNVMLVYGGARLIDFGISRIEGASKSSTHFYGANGYTSPEHYTEDASPKNDVFVAATILAFAGTGNQTWKADSNGRFEGSIFNDQPNYKGLSDKQQTLLRAMHRKVPAERASVAQALTLLKSTRSGAANVKPEPIRAVKAAKQLPNKPVPVKATPNPAGAAAHSSDRMSVGDFLNKNKGLIALGLFTGGWGLLAYWLWRRWKKLEPMEQPVILRVGVSAALSAIGYGIFTFIPLFYWSKKLADRKLFWTAFWSAFLPVPSILALSAKNPSGERPAISSLYFGLILVLTYRTHRRIYHTLKNGEPPVKKEKVKKQKEDKAPSRVAAQDIPNQAPESSNPPHSEFQELSDSAMTTGEQSWDAVESTIFKYLAGRKGKQFSIEILSNKFTGIYFQGYSEPGGYITVEAASNLSVKPPLEIENRKGLIKIGWEPPSDGLPNFIKFLDLKESENSEIAKLFVETLRDGYLLELGTFKVEV